MTAVPTPPAPDAVDRLAADVLATGRALGLPKLVAALAEPTGPPAGHASAVVAGAAGRGKTALVGALLELPLPSPVPTTAHVGIVHADTPWAATHRDGTRTPAPSAPDAFAAAGADLVEIGWPHPLLARGIELVDTPGIDTRPRHEEITLAALALADALVFVLDPGSPVTAPELAFLARGTERIGTVVFAVSRVDRFPAWREVVAEHRALIARHAPRFADAPVLPVSATLATLAVRATAAGRPAVAARARADSGIDALRSALARVADELDAVRARNRLQLCRVVALGLRNTVALLGAEPDAAAPVADATVRLRALDDDRAPWRGELTGSLRALGHDVEARLTAALRALTERFDESLRSWSAQRATTLSTELDDALRAVRLDAVAAAQQGLVGVVDRLATTFARDGVVFAAPRVAVGDAAVPDRPRLVVEVDPTTQGVAGAVTAYTTAAALTLSSHTALMLVLPALGPLGLAIGAAVGVGGIVARRRALAKAAQQRGARRLVAQTLTDARAELGRDLTRLLTGARLALETAVTDALRERLRVLTAEQAAADAARRRDAARDRDARARARSALGPVQALVDRAEALGRA